MSITTTEEVEQPVPISGFHWLSFGFGLVGGAALVGIVWLVVGLSGSGMDQPETFTLGGTMTLTASQLGGSDSTCFGVGGYGDIIEGSAVTVYGANGNVIATGVLGRGTRSSSNICTFSVRVPNVPANETFYQVEISHRGKVTVEAARAKSMGVLASLGN